MSERSTLSIDPRAVEAKRVAMAQRLWRDAADAPPPQTRVVPLPVAFMAVALPLLAAWATAEPGRAYVPERSAGARALPEPLETLGRGDRVQATGEGYVDVWGPLAPWEARFVEDRGYQQAR